MKTTTLLLGFVFSVVSVTEGLAQEATPPELSKFLIQVETADSDKVNLTCTEGCAWETLSFSLSEKGAQAVDEYGMADPENLDSRVNPELADFLFSISKTENGVDLKGLDGTAWTSLRFGLASKEVQAIDEMGMTP